MKIRQGDIVKVISGAYNGKQGRVLKVLNFRDRLIVEGVNNSYALSQIILWPVSHHACIFIEKINQQKKINFFIRCTIIFLQRLRLI